MNSELNNINNSENTEIINILQSSLYPGASTESIKMVLSYCKASRLDPMLKPVHIVPMFCSTGQKTKDGKDIKAMRDVVMPGIGLYRIQASRTEQFAGISEPEFGEDITAKIGNVEMTYPAWCKITAKRLMANGMIAEFTAKEFWKENYATKSRDDKSPNAMWERRPYAQLSKCTEAQALRKAFHELGSQPTYDEMEGKEIDITPPRQPIEEKKLPDYPDAKVEANKAAWLSAIESGKHTHESIINMISTKNTLTDEQKEIIRNLGAIDANS